MKLLPLFLLAISGIYNSQAILGSLTLSDVEMDRLKRGEIITRELEDRRQGQTFEAYAIFPSGKQRSVDVISDFAQYPQFMPNVERIEILEQTSSHAILNYYLVLPLEQKKRYRLVILQQEQGDATIIQWQMLDWPEVPEEERIGNTNGFWILQPYDDNQTLVHYHVYTDPGKVPFGLGWIVDYMSASSIPKVLANTRDYAGKQ